MADVSLWSTSIGTANGTTDPDINWVEGQAPGTVNDSSRNMMAAIARWKQDNDVAIFTTGTGAAYVGTGTTAYSSLTDGLTVQVWWHTTNTVTAPTFQLGSLAATVIKTRYNNPIPIGMLNGNAIIQYSTGFSCWRVMFIGDSPEYLGLNNANEIRVGGAMRFEGDITYPLNFNKALTSSYKQQITFSIATNPTWAIGASINNDTGHDFFLYDALNSAPLIGWTPSQQIIYQTSAATPPQLTLQHGGFGGTGYRSQINFTTTGTTHWQIGVDANENGTPDLFFYNGASRFNMDTVGRLCLGGTAGTSGSQDGAILTLNGGQMGSAVNSVLVHQVWQSIDNNNDRLRIYAARLSAGSDWQNVNWVFDRYVDTTPKQAIKYQTSSGVPQILLIPDGTTNAGAVVLQPAAFGGAGLFPIQDNLGSCGLTGNRWQQVCAVFGAIVTSDLREKETPTRLSAREIRAWSKVSPVIYRWKQFMNKDGLCAGFIVQHIQKAFEDEDLDWRQYGMIQGGGQRDDGSYVAYGLNYNDCFAFEAAFQRDRADKAEARMDRLHERLSNLEEIIAMGSLRR